ncbi:uncharacterized protein LOC111830460 [Capsella rubella]|uniref:uncharacterized protein LOC111830460 n=1 Tax=Capsella rubella TaxID=81985 RepID=UPI000CD507E7|nr:uncharacterized protein LOC111830460 [Capsella rubella]
MAKKPYSPSFGWRSILSTKSLVEKGARWSIGSGFDISVWKDRWIPDINPRPASGRGILLHPNLKVNHLVNPITKKWHLPILNEFMHPEDIRIIRSMSISKTYKPDRLIWHYTKSGKYTVKSGYWLAHNLIGEAEENPSYTALKAYAWHIRTPPKIKHFIWQIATGTLPVMDALASRKIQCDTDRNKKVFQGIQSEPVDIINQALSEQLSWEEAQISLTDVTEPIEPVSPPSLIVRCRIDGSWKSGNMFSGLGWWCFRGEEKTYILGAKCLRGCPSPLHSELEALLWAMENILIRRIDCHTFESDCAELIAMVQDPQEWPAFSNLLDDFLLLRASFPSFSLTKISRTCNSKADCLARSSRSLDS